MKWGKWEVKRTRGGISEKPIWSPRMCLQSSSQSRENILRPYKTQNPDGCNVANCLIFTFLRFSKNVAKSDLHVTHLNKLTFRPKHNALLSSPACICIYWRIHSVPLWWFLCPHSLVLVLFHFTLIQSVFFSFFFHNALTSLLTECYYFVQKQTRALFLGRTCFTQLGSDLLASTHYRTVRRSWCQMTQPRWP